MARVALEHLNYRYPSGVPALEDVSFQVEAGQCVGLIGPNGSGKSTLLMHLNGLLPDGGGTGDGVVRIGSSVLGQANLWEIRRQVGLLFQDPDDQLFCPTLFADVAFGPEQLGLAGRELQQRVEQALTEVGLAGLAGRSPSQLSGGEKRLACLAGVLACQPQVLALDEPTAGLDPRGRRQIKALLARLPITRVIATHDLEMVVELCDLAIVLDGGKVVAQGPVRQLLGDEPLMLRHGLERPNILLHDAQHQHGHHHHGG